MALLDEKREIIHIPRIVFETESRVQMLQPLAVSPLAPGLSDQIVMSLGRIEFVAQPENSADGILIVQIEYHLDGLHPVGVHGQDFALLLR